MNKQKNIFSKIVMLIAIVCLIAGGLYFWNRFRNPNYQYKFVNETSTNVDLQYLGETLEIETINFTSEEAIVKDDTNTTLVSYYSITKNENRITIRYSQLVSSTVSVIFHIETNNKIVGRNFSITFWKDSDDNTEGDPFKFIYDRTFSICCTPGDGFIHFGTGWIYKHISNYEYYMLTNWHVTWSWVAIDESSRYQINSTQNTEFTISSDVYYGCLDAANGYEYEPTNTNNKINYLGDYAKFSSVKIEFQCNNYLSSSVVDAQVLKVNFGDNPAHRNKLDQINTYCSNNNNYAFHIASYEDVVNQETIYIAGYPCSEGNGERWTLWRRVNDYIVVKDIYTHNVNSSSPYISTQNLKAFTHSPNANLRPGSSGSVVIRMNSTTGKYEIVSIYWGGLSYGNTWICGKSDALKTSSYNIFDGL